MVLRQNFQVNSNEWHLDTSIAAAGRSKVLQFVVYIFFIQCPASFFFGLIMLLIKLSGHFNLSEIICFTIHDKMFIIFDELNYAVLIGMVLLILY